MGVVLMGMLVGLMFALVVELKTTPCMIRMKSAAYLKLPVMVALPKCRWGERQNVVDEYGWKLRGRAREAMETQGYGEEQMKVANIQQESAAFKQMDLSVPTVTEPAVLTPRAVTSSNLPVRQLDLSQISQVAGDAGPERGWIWIRSSR